MDFTKYASMLTKQALFFCRIDKLGDQYEMSMPIENIKSSTEYYNNNEEIIKRNLSGITLKEWNSLFDIIKPSVLINSWHRNDYESAAMWSIYLKTNEGIAIQSTYKKLCDSFNLTDDEINIGTVSYKDYQMDRIDDETLFGYASHKLKSYEYERELRAMLTNQTDGSQKPLYEVGKNVPVVLDTLVECVYVAPNAQKWYGELVIDLTKRLGYNFPIKMSSLNDRSLH
ncbi:MAG: hypothetical protein JST90_12370 [Bacteroidetes bacterium]|nr:hypothetical protein [Bacteroidota bacterium]